MTNNYWPTSWSVQMLFNCKFHDPRGRGYCARAGHISHIVKMFNNFVKEVLVHCRIKIRQIKTIHVYLLFEIFFIFIFYSYGDVTITSEVLQIMIYTRHSWTLSSEGTLACHTYFNTGHPFIMVISEDTWHSHLLLSSGAVTTCFYDLCLLRQGFGNPTFSFRDETHCATAAALYTCSNDDKGRDRYQCVSVWSYWWKRKC